MGDWTPGEGWRETTDFARAEIVHYPDGQMEGGRGWVREAPVPALPTVPGTVIEVMSTIRQEIDVTPWFLTPNQEWAPVGHYACSVDGGLHVKDVTSFRILSEPRAVTAKAVLDRAMITGISGSAVDDLYREFGVES